jgi:N-acylneuraminate cytidylyltransferase
MAYSQRAQRTVAIIPARGGSKGVPGKNLRTVGGVSLVARAVRSCLSADLIDAVFVSTDDEAIAAEARAAGAGVIRRPAELAGDLATSESALLHGLDTLASRANQADPQVLVFVQCTSPFIDACDLDAAVAAILEQRADSAFAGVASYQFLWRDAHPLSAPGSRSVVGQNHDAAYRPRRQDRRPDFRETGAFYAMSVAGFRSHRHRFFGRTTVIEVAELTAMEIDTVDELALAQAVATLVDVAETTQVDVDAVITDFDGVHTPDTAYLDQTGQESVRVSRSDGLGIAALRAAGVPMLIVSKERNPVVTARAQKLGIDVLQGIDDKEPAVREWLQRQAVEPARAAYLGNDVNDLGAMAAVGWAVAVADAHPAALAAARLVLSRRGGEGAVRELCDLVMNTRRLNDAGAASSAPVAAPTRQPPVAAAEAAGATGSQPSRTV